MIDAGNWNRNDKSSFLEGMGSTEETVGGSEPTAVSVGELIGHKLGQWVLTLEGNLQEHRFGESEGLSPSRTVLCDRCRDNSRLDASEATRRMGML